MNSARLLSNNRSVLRWISISVGLAGLALVLLSVWASATLGSVGAALAYLGGERILVDAYSKSFGTIGLGAERTITFVITNATDRPVKLVGAMTSCTCLRAVELPITVSPKGGSRAVRFIYRGAQKPVQVLEKLRIFTDHPLHRWVDVTVKGSVASPTVLRSRLAIPVIDTLANLQREVLRQRCRPRCKSDCICRRTNGSLARRRHERQSGHALPDKRVGSAHHLLWTVANSAITDDWANCAGEDVDVLESLRASRAQSTTEAFTFT